jgi:hypothetical protein
MRYQHVLLSALAGVVVAKDDSSTGTISPRNGADAAPDALPFEELRDIPVPTHTIATEHTAQVVPYETAAAMDLVSSNIANAPLSFFPAAKDVPFNAAGTSNNNANTNHNTNIIQAPEYLEKRSPNRVAHQPHKRAVCSPSPTIANFYKVNLTNATLFRADPIIASVANAAKPTPTGFYQTFKNLQGATSTMNYLGFLPIPNLQGYDVDYCASKCSAKAGCLAFNIYFQRTPVQSPSNDCPNPAPYASIRCSLWGTAITNATATNKGSGNYKFVVAIAGSNGYVSYKLQKPPGPINGYTVQSLNASIMNAPLRDCANSWTYLGYKLLQTGSVDPRLCAAICDAQTSYNVAHPVRGTNTPTCNAFGSYILTRTNLTASKLPAAPVQLGQMCTLYTANWDAKFAIGNTAAWDDAKRLKYTFSSSSFYGKVDKQLKCFGGGNGPFGK